MCEGSASIAVNRDVVEGACDEREVLLVGLLTRPRSDRGRSCERVTAIRVHGQTGNRTNAGRAITPFMFNEEEYQVSVPLSIVTHVLNSP